MHKRILAALGAAILSHAHADSPPLPANTAIEYYHAAFDHYFITSLRTEIAALDAGTISGWSRTGRGFAVFEAPPQGTFTVSPVCRFYIPPQRGDSHFFSASPAECATIRDKIGVDPNYSGYIEETPAAFFISLPSTANGTCPTGTSPLYRLWNQRADSNHRYTTDAGIKAYMQSKSYVAEGYGPDAVAMCTTQPLLVDALVPTSGLSPFSANCEAVTTGGIAHLNSEVEPSIAVNPANPNNMIAAWQQDRWSNGGARGLAAAYSFDGGGTWTSTLAPMSRCTGGAGANAFERATDPWLTFAPDGTAYMAALAYNNVQNGDNAILVSRSTDGGHTWSAATAVRRDNAAFFNDKEAITADGTDARYVYVVWDRLANNNAPTWFARTTDAGATWEAARNIYDPGQNRQTINNIVVVLPDGTLILFFSELPTTDGGGPALLRIMRSTDKGVTWSAPITVSNLQTVGTVDPETGVGIRDGSAIGAIAAGANGVLAVTWQDSRFSGGAYDGIAFSRSTDGGLTWSAPARINGFPSVPALIPSVAIRADGTIGVAYYDFRSNTADPNTLFTDFWLTTSSDGVTWSERRLDHFDYAKAPVVGGRYFLGDYMGMASAGTSFVVAFGRTNASADNRADIVTSLARPSPFTPTARVKAAADEGIAPTAETQARIDAAIREAVRARRREP